MSSRVNMGSRFVDDCVASSILIGCLVFAPACAWSQKKPPPKQQPPQQTQQPPASVRQLPPAAAAQNSTNYHNADTTTGQHVGMSGGEQTAIIGSIVGAAALTIWGIHHETHKLPSSDDLMKNGPRVPESILMNHLVVDGIIGPGWPVGIDFQLEGPGTVTLDITTADKVHYQQVLTNDLNGRGITVTRPPDLPDKLQAATFDVEAVAPAGSNLAPPTLHMYGMAAGPDVVHSIAIDQVSFGPSALKMKEQAQFAFHSHSDFSNVRADFMFTGVQDNHIVMKQDSEAQLSPVSADEHAQGVLQGKGTAGEHLLQIRAWRGNSGDWVVAWSPDVVTLTK
jgi:hypothetical protein